MQKKSKLLPTFWHPEIDFNSSTKNMQLNDVIFNAPAIREIF